MYTTFEAPDMFSPHILKIDDIKKVNTHQWVFVNVQKICDFTCQICGPPYISQIHPHHSVVDNHWLSGFTQMTLLCWFQTILPAIDLGRSIIDHYFNSIIGLCNNNHIISWLLYSAQKCKLNYGKYACKIAKTHNSYSKNVSLNINTILIQINYKIWIKIQKSKHMIFCSDLNRSFKSNDLNRTTLLHIVTHHILLYLYCKTNVHYSLINSY